MTVYINNNLKELRKELGISQAVFADKLGITRSSLGAYEENRAQPPLLVITKAMELCQIPPEDMYDLIFDPQYLS